MVLLYGAAEYSRGLRREGTLPFHRAWNLFFSPSPSPLEDNSRGLFIGEQRTLSLFEEKAPSRSIEAGIFFSLSPRPSRIARGEK
jgi:hypothetical protein